MKHDKFYRLLVSLLMLLILMGCDSTPIPHKNEHPPVIQSVSFSPKLVVAGGKATLTAIATDANNDPLVFYWEAQQGTVPHGAQRDTVDYIAPTFSGIDVIQVTASDGVSVDTKTIHVSVIESTTVSNPSPVLPTDTPVLILTNTWTPAPSPSPPVHPLPTNTPTAEPTQSSNRARVCRTAASGFGCPDNRQSTGNNGDWFCTETITFPSTIHATGIVISMTKRPPEHMNWGFSLWEVEAYQGVGTGTNLAKGGTADASSEEPQTPWVASDAVDGLMNTRWSSAQGMAKPDKEIGPQWLKIVLPQPADVDRIVLKWQDAYALEYCVEILQ